MSIHTLSDSVEAALRKEDLIPTGISGVDNLVGGIAPGFPLVIGAMTGVGKSNLIQSAALSCPAKVGIISLEDTPDVWGSRLIARYSGLNSRDLRLGTLDEKAQEKADTAREEVRKIYNVLIAYRIGGSLESVLDATNELADAGCQIVWLDYLHKIKGRGNRKDDVSYAYSEFQRVCYERQIAPAVAMQFSRKTVWAGDHTREANVFDKPRISWLKDSGDLENEARLILLGNRDPDNSDVVQWHVAKSTIGGVSKKFLYKFKPCGTLVELDDTNDQPF